jgi:hypothetical protein
MANIETAVKDKVVPHTAGRIPVNAYVLHEWASEERSRTMLWWTLWQLRSKNPETRARAAHKLGGSRKARAVESLVAVLGDKDRQVRETAAQALRQLGDARAVEPLVRLATEDTYCAQTSIIALQRIIECAAAKLAPKDLRTIAHLEGVVQWRYGGDCQESYEDAVDCSHVRQLARQELIRRGLEA